jgi:hypothetical protein
MTINVEEIGKNGEEIIYSSICKKMPSKSARHSV